MRFEAVAEIQLAAHGGRGDSRHLVADSGNLGQLVDDLGINQGGIHIEASQRRYPLTAAFLQNQIGSNFLGQLQAGKSRRGKLQFSTELEANYRALVPVG